MVTRKLAESAGRPGAAARRRATPFAAIAALAFLTACTAGSVMDLTPAVDVGATTAAIPRAAAPVPQPTSTQETAQAPQTAAPAIEPAYPDMSADQLYAAQLAAIGAPAPPDPAATLPSPAMETEPAAEEETVAMVAPPEPARPEPAAVPAPPRPSPRPAPPVADETPKPSPRAEARPKPILAGFPRIDNPFRRARPDAGSGMPAEEVACRRDLKRLGVTYTDIPRVGKGGSCGIAWPVKVTSLSGGIRMRPAAVLTCEMAATFARWTKNELAPAARLRYLSGIRQINNGTYSCRRIAGSRTFSAHSKGNAIDIMSFDLDNGRNIDVTKPGFFAFRQRGLLNTVRKDGCQYFTTVLGPGYNYDHRNHFHFDLMHRKSGHRACR